MPKIILHDKRNVYPLVPLISENIQGAFKCKYVYTNFSGYCSDFVLSQCKMTHNPFFDYHIRHPDTTQGPPIGIDWLYQKMGTFNLDEFEANRRKASRRRYDRQREKGNKAFLIPPKVREALLIETGTTKADMRAAVREVQTCQQQRRESKEAQGSEDWLLIKEACKRRYRRWKSGVSKKREQELLWERAAARMSQITNSQAISPAS